MTNNRNYLFRLDYSYLGFSINIPVFLSGVNLSIFNQFKFFKSQEFYEF